MLQKPNKVGNLSDEEENLTTERGHRPHMYTCLHPISLNILDWYMANYGIKRNLD